MSKRILIFHPDIYKHHTSNEHHISVYKSISNYREIRSFEWFLKNPFNKDIDTLFLNWYENTLGNGNIKKQRLQYFIKKQVLKFAKRRGIRIIYVFHNKAPHNVNIDSNFYKNVVKPFMTYCIKMADTIVVLSKSSIKYIKSEFCGVTIDSKIELIPHGTYKRQNFDANYIQQKYGIKGGMLLVILGQMSKYKNTDIAIRAFIESNIKGTLLLAGSCSEDYASKLMEICGNRENIIIHAEHINDVEYSALMQIADAAVLPYENTSLNSGVMINAFSNGTTIIGTKIEMLDDFPSDLVYGYSYINEIEHVKALAAAIKNARADYCAGKLKEKGTKLEQIVKQNNNWDIVDESIRRVLDEK